MRILLLAAAPLLLAALPAAARDPATAEISSGDYASAEAKLDAELRVHPGRPELLLNLAAVYLRTGREAQARNLYREVLAQREVLMDLRTEKTAGSHQIAQNGLRQLVSVQSASR